MKAYEYYTQGVCSRQIHVEIDDQGRINLSRRDALVEINGAVVEDDADEAPQQKPQRKGGRERRGFKKHE